MPRPTFFNLPEDKRRNLVEIALDEFAEHTYTGFSISRFVARAGVAKGSFYQYFDDKMDLFRWLLFEDGGRRKLEFIRNSGALDSSDWWSMLASIMLAGIGFGLANPRLARVSMAVWFPSGDPDLHALHVQTQALSRQAMRNLLTQGQEAGAVRKDIDLELGAELLVSVSQKGMDLAVVRKVGVDLLTFCSRPELADRFPRSEQVVLIGQVVDLLRRALGTANPPAEASIDIDRVSTLSWEPS